jgi:2-polyprenyl-3-methyl-5-hydroxy-6-metoxy-1,4-benzoquinol methylase
VTDLWSERAQAYRESDAHREGRDLELFADWADGQTALDVATGGGNVARVLRDAGLEVVTIDSAPGMQPTVVSRAEEIPFADSSFDVVACRVAAHHFEDPHLGRHHDRRGFHRETAWCSPQSVPTSSRPVKASSLDYASPSSAWLN